MRPTPRLTAFTGAVVVLAGALVAYPSATRGGGPGTTVPAVVDVPSAAVVTQRPEVQLLTTSPVTAAAEARGPGVDVRGDSDAAVVQAVVEAALRSIAESGGLATSASGGVCPTADLLVAWSLPAGEYRAGAHIEPLGPAPSAGVAAVSGVVRCAAVPDVYAGFEALREGDRWLVVLVPDPEPFGGHGSEHEANDPDPVTAERAPAPVAGTSLADAGRTADGIEAYAEYEPQATCSPSVKPGTAALRDLLLSRWPSTRSLGITRACDVGGTSEHKEGRAFDWGADVRDPTDRAAVELTLGEMLATDDAGNAHALARRMGVMYMIWNRQIWSAYHADAGWRGYAGSSPHTDHVHLSLSWDGAEGRTSYWSGTVAGTEPTPPPDEEPEEDRGLLGTGLLAGSDPGSGEEPGAGSGEEPDPDPEPRPGPLPLPFGDRSVRTLAVPAPVGRVSRAP